MKVFESICVTLFILGLFALGFIGDMVCSGASLVIMWWYIPIAILLWGTAFSMSIKK